MQCLLHSRCNADVESCTTFYSKLIEVLFGQVLTQIRKGKQAEECIPANAAPAGAWECELWSRLYGSPSISRKATVYSTPVTDVSLSWLPAEACSAFYPRRAAQQAQTWMRRISTCGGTLQNMQASCPSGCKCACASGNCAHSKMSSTTSDYCQG